jgi:hypothetical protein
MYRTRDLDCGFAAGFKVTTFGEVDKDVLGERGGCEGGEDGKGLHFGWLGQINEWKVGCVVDTDGWRILSRLLQRTGNFIPQLNGEAKE